MAKSEGLDITTAFMVVQTIDGEVHVMRDLPMEKVREASFADIEMMSHYVYTQIRNSLDAPEQTPEQRIAAQLASRLGEASG